MNKNLDKHYKLPLFLFLAYGITWLLWIPALVIANAQGYLLPSILNVSGLSETGFENSQHLQISILFSLAVYGPLIAALIATALEKGKAGLSELFQRITKWRVAPRWYAIAFGLALIIPLIPRLIGEISGQMQPIQNAISLTAPLLLIFFLRQMLTSGVGEEPGWRGYLLPRLQTLYGSDKAIWILGIIWAAWHFPFTIYDTLTKINNLPTAALVLTLVMALAGQSMSLIGMTYLYVWLYNKTQSIFLSILFHALSNLLPAILLIGLSPSLGILIALIPWLIVFALEKYLGKENFPGAAPQ